MYITSSVLANTVIKKYITNGQQTQLIFDWTVKQTYDFILETFLFVYLNNLIKITTFILLILLNKTQKFFHKNYLAECLTLCSGFL